MPDVLRTLLVLALTAGGWFVPAGLPAAEMLTERMHHLRAGAEREWAEFPETAEGRELRLSFAAAPDPDERTLRLRQQDVKQTWTIHLNDRLLGRLHRDENDMTVYWTVRSGALRAGENVLRIEPAGAAADDVRVGEIALHQRPVAEVLAEARVEVTVLDADTLEPVPCRLTVINDRGSLQSVGAVSDERMAVRPGVIYAGHGQAAFGLPAGEYTIHAGRGFEYGLDSVRLSLEPGAREHATLTIRREVPTAGWVSCDTHVHTLTHSGHGDATIEERMHTIAGEGIELPVAADHNRHVDYEPVARRLRLRRHFTPVIGNEVTTPVGHFNIFPVEAGAPVPEHRLEDWERIFEGIRATPGVKAVILNHPRDVHSGFRPFGPRRFNAATGKSLDGWRLEANAMEVINSGAQQSDVMRLYHDWFALLNRGQIVTPVGSSDSHDVARHFVGQARTYIRCADGDPGAIDVAAAAESFVQGRVMVSLGLLCEIEVDGRYGPGDRVPVGEDVQVAVRVLGPAWTTAETVELYVNGQKRHEAEIPRAEGTRAGVKWAGAWTLPRPRHDVHLAAIARGPGVRALSWPIARPYQPTSPVWEPQVVGSTGAVWLDADGDGRRTSAYDYARQVVESTGMRVSDVTRALAGYDEAVAAQAAGLLHANGVSVLEPAARSAARTAGPQVERGFTAFRAAWRETEVARGSGAE